MGAIAIRTSLGLLAAAGVDGFIFLKFNYLRSLASASVRAITERSSLRFSARAECFNVSGFDFDFERFILPLSHNVFLIVSWLY